MNRIRMPLCFLILMVVAAQAGASDYPALTERDADRAALRYANGGKITRRVLRRRDGRGVYNYVIVNDGHRIKLQVDAEDGSMRKYEREPVNTSERAPAGLGEARILSHDQAKEIALERSGGGIVVEAERDYKRDGRVLYEIEIHNGNMEYEIVVDGRTGRVVKYEEDRLD